MKIYNDSNKEYLLPGAKKGETIFLGPKKTVEVADKLGEKLLKVKAYHGLRNAEELAGEKSQSVKELKAEVKKYKDAAERLGAENKELKDIVAAFRKGKEPKATEDKK